MTRTEELERDLTAQTKRAEEAEAKLAEADRHHDEHHAREATMQPRCVSCDSEPNACGPGCDCMHAPCRHDFNAAKRNLATLREAVSVVVADMYASIDDAERYEVDRRILGWCLALGGVAQGLWNDHQRELRIRDEQIRALREALSSLVTALPRCDECSCPATRARGRVGERYCDEHGPGATEYPRAAPLRKAIALLEKP